jgi:hypothetical protein
MGVCGTSSGTLAAVVAMSHRLSGAEAELAENERLVGALQTRMAAVQARVAVAETGGRSVMSNILAESWTAAAAGYVVPSCSVGACVFR